MKSIYEEPKLEIIKFNIEERIMTLDDDDPLGTFPVTPESDLEGGGSEPPIWG